MALLDIFPTSIPSLQSDANLGPFPPRSQKFMALSHPKVPSSAQGQRWSNPETCLLAPAQGPSAGTSCPSLPSSSLHATSTSWAFVAGSLPPRLGHSLEIFTRFLDLAPEQRETGCFSGQGWLTRIPNAKAFVSLRENTTMFYILSCLSFRFPMEIKLGFFFSSSSSRFWFIPSVPAFPGWSPPSPPLVEGKS